MDKDELSEEINEIVELLKSSLSSRAKKVVEHIQKHGYITTEDLKEKYNYDHPPRAARDVREAGIPLETFRVKSTSGRSIAAYKFGDLLQIEKDKLGGREVIPKWFKDELYRLNHGKCAICFGHFESRYLQTDHRVPYEISGDKKGLERDVKDYMLLCGSCNRAKSWSCEHCSNWLKDKLPEICSKCYWASPESYTHVALREVRRIDIIWDEKEMHVYEKLKSLAEKNMYSVPDYVKKIIKQYMNENKT